MQFDKARITSPNTMKEGVKLVIKESTGVHTKFHKS